MNQYFASLKFPKASCSLRQAGRVAFLAMMGLLFSSPALAHHPFGGETPDSVFEAFVSGLGHPVIGLDHLAFVIAAGLLAAVMGRGLVIPVAFVIASLAGTGIHLMSLDLPAPELFISASVLVFGILLAMKSQPNRATVAGLAAIAGVFHGYAYGEAIVGAEMGPLVAYLVGFAVIQMAIALMAYWVGRAVSQQAAEPSGIGLRFAGFVICGVGGTFLSTLIVDTMLPA
ncbi:HupE/UreJ family protein [Vasconcelosia minhoensis]|nr:HupE/UreJ family protein [Romeria gracilis]